MNLQSFDQIKLQSLDVVGLSATGDDGFGVINTQRTLPIEVAGRPFSVVFKSNDEAGAPTSFPATINYTIQVNNSRYLDPTIQRAFHPSQLGIQSVYEKAYNNGLLDIEPSNLDSTFNANWVDLSGGLDPTTVSFYSSGMAGDYGFRYIRVVSNVPMTSNEKIFVYYGGLDHMGK